MLTKFVCQNILDKSKLIYESIKSIRQGGKEIKMDKVYQILGEANDPLLGFTIEKLRLLSKKISDNIYYHQRIITDKPKTVLEKVFELS